MSICFHLLIKTNQTHIHSHVIPVSKQSILHAHVLTHADQIDAKMPHSDTVGLTPDVKEADVAEHMDAHASRSGSNTTTQEVLRSVLKLSELKGAEGVEEKLEKR